MPRAFLTAYGPSGAARVYAGEPVIFDFCLLAREGETLEAEDLAGRIFKHRIIDADGAVKKIYSHELYTDALGRIYARFTCPAADTLELLPADADKVALAHLIAERNEEDTEDLEWILPPSPWVLWKARAR